jgi:formylglycine-generating enzyme required for sulfatase activity
MPVPIPAGAVGAPGTYCVDRTEVTNSQYADFLATNPSTASQPSYCSWNTNFAPESQSGTCSSVDLYYDPINRAAYPVACVDWCDAAAYCKAIGKHLCRSFDGGSVPPSSGASATVDEWYAACSFGGVNKYPYGNTYGSTTCNMDLFGSAGSIVVGSASACDVHSASVDLHILDMNGNVSEWEDACNGTAGANDNCNMRGGDFLSYDATPSPPPAQTGNCVALPSSPRSRRAAGIGFRCCYDSNP